MTISRRAVNWDFDSLGKILTDFIVSVKISVQLVVPATQDKHESKKVPEL